MQMKWHAAEADWGVTLLLGADHRLTAPDFVDYDREFAPSRARTRFNMTSSITTPRRHRW